MADFKRGGGFGGGDRGGRGGDSNRGGFGKPRFGGKPGFKPSFNRNEAGRDGGDKEMFDAVCSTCGRACQVPFRPSGDRPIFCKDCFAKTSGREMTDSRDRRDAPPRTNVVRRDDSFSARPKAFEQDPRIDDMKRDLAYMHVKLDKLTELVGSMALTKAVKSAVEDTSDAPLAPKVKTKKKKVG